MKKIRLVILGVGRWGVHLVRNFLEHPAAEIVAIVDPIREYLSKCQINFNLQGIVLETDWQSVRHLAGIDAVVIATPAITHYALIKDALELGYHVFTEKPLTLTIQESQQLTDLAKQLNKQLFVDHTYLFHPVVEKGRQILAQNKIGNLYYGYGSRTNLGPVRNDVDVLWDLALHDLAILGYWLNERPERVQAQGHNYLKSTSLADTVLTTLLYPSGVQVSLHFSWLNPDKQRRLCLVGENGTLIFDEMCQESPLKVMLGGIDEQNSQPRGAVFREKIETPAVEPLKKVCDCFLEAVKNNQPDPRATGEVATELIEILTSLSRSMQQKGEWMTVNN